MSETKDCHADEEKRDRAGVRGFLNILRGERARDITYSEELMNDAKKDLFT